MFVEEGFRIRFANGEVIDFYADNRDQKEGWMKVLSETVGKDIASGKAWTDMVLEKERREKAARAQAPSSIPTPTQPNSSKSHHQRTQSHDAFGASRPPPNPHKAPVRPQSSHGPTPPAKDARHAPAPAPAPAPKQRDGAGSSSQSGRREQVRSMIF